MSHDSEFLAHYAPPLEKKKITRRRFFKVGLFLLSLLIGLTAIWTAVNAGLVVTSLLDGRDRLYEAKDAVEVFSFDEAKVSLDAAEIAFVKADRSFKRIAWLKFLPWVGEQVVAAETLLDSSSDLFALVDDIADLGADITRLIGETENVTGEVGEFLPLQYDDMSPTVKRIVLQRINGAAPDLALVAEKAGLIKNNIDDLGDVPEPMGTVVRKIENTLDQVYDGLFLAATAARIIPAFTGLGEEKNFLLLLENNTEMRPAGGFIGTYGILRVEDGEIRELELKDSYLLDEAANPYYSLEPPTPLKKYLGANKWFFRDSNWSPDFSVSARNAISMFTAEVLSIPSEQRNAVQEPISFDGVIGITPTFVADLLKITGPIVVGNQTFSADNITDTLEYQVEIGFQESGVPYAQRKDIITSLFNEMKGKIFDLPFSAWGPVVSAVEKNLSDKQIALFSNSSLETEEIIRNAGWGGVVEKSDGDFLMVIDANLAALKTDPEVLRDISYSIKPSGDGRFIGKVTIKYEHQGVFDWKTTRYRTYTRVYVPKGSQFISGLGMLANDKLKNPSGAAGAVDVGQELDLTVFGAFISIEPGESGRLSFEYYLPDSITTMVASGHYSLNVVKQLGAAEYGLTTTLDFDKKVMSATPAELTDFWGDDNYTGAFGLAKDLNIEVGF
ncbi:MAG: DUF4012 domain-containing protein [Patescibacteria group bacterium]|jgi:hypothetical protein